MNTNPGRVASCYSPLRNTDRAVSLLLVGFLVLLAGCRTEPQAFQPNRLVAEIQAQENGVPMSQAIEDVQAILETLFGTLNDPQFPSVEGLSSEGLVDLSRLKRAAGPVYSDEQDVHYGLFREHCATCHGISGTGRGPAAALQNPYPRDFTAGVFKYKSTERGKKPTRADLTRTLYWGLAGSSMPAFSLVDPEELEAIVDYLIYLSARGEVERRLLEIAGRELNYDPASGVKVERWVTPEQWESAEGELAAQVSEQRQWIDDVVRKVLSDWLTADQFVVAATVPDFMSERAESSGVDSGRAERIAAGREIFHGQIANCASCHGENGAGLAHLPADYDDWTKEWSIRMGIDPKNKGQLAPYFAAGALKPRTSIPRNLQHGVFRGGREPEQVYRRMVLGIEGTPMPAVSRVSGGPGGVPSGVPSGAGLTEEQLWQLVEYVLSLGPVGLDGDATVAESETLEVRKEGEAAT